MTLSRLQKIYNEVEDIKERIELALENEIRISGSVRLSTTSHGSFIITKFYFNSWTLHYGFDDGGKGYIDIFEIEGIG